VSRAPSAKRRRALSSQCHCGAVRIELPRRPRTVTECNCSICRRYGTRWAYYTARTVRILGHPTHTDSYACGDRRIRLVRCRQCGCVTHWESVVGDPESRMGVNVRNVEPGAIGRVRLRLLDGADTWRDLNAGRSDFLEL
jgi:hypothetical protein